jgi:hypothetical protein
MAKERRDITKQDAPPAILKRKRNQSTQSKRKKPKTEITPQERCLTNLAWLLEESESNCFALCLVNNKLLIAANNIHSGTRDSKLLTMVADTMSYLSQFVVEKDVSEKRKEVIKKIFLEKIGNRYKGQLAAQFDEAAREKVVDSFLENPEISPKNMDKKLAEVCNAHYQEDSLAAMIEIGKKVQRRLDRVEKFLKNNTDSPLAMALKGYAKSQKVKHIKLSDSAASLSDRDWLLDSNDAGCALLLTNDHLVHAELKVVDYLLVSRLLTSKESLYQSYYIGISKRCCYDCSRVIKLVNDYAKNELKQEEIIKIMAESHRSYSNWGVPKFLFTPDELGLKRHKDHCPEGYISTKKIYKQFMSLDEIIKNKNIDRESVFLHRDYNFIDDVCVSFKKLPEPVHNGNKTTMSNPSSDDEGSCEEKVTVPVISNDTFNDTLMLSSNDALMKVLAIRLKAGSLDVKEVATMIAPYLENSESIKKEEETQLSQTALLNGIGFLDSSGKNKCLHNFSTLVKFEEKDVLECTKN